MHYLDDIFCCRETNAEVAVVVVANALGMFPRHIINGEIQLALFLLHRFCTTDKGFDAALHDHIVSHVEMLDADAASDEQLTMRILAESFDETQPALFPNVKLLIKDPTHAARRLTRNSWKADCYLSGVFAQIITSGEGIVSLIQNSADLRGIFKDNVTADPTIDLNIHNLGFAPHRFDSQVSCNIQAKQKQEHRDHKRERSKAIIGNNW